MADWNNESARDAALSPHLHRTTQLLSLLRASLFVPEPLAHAADLVGGLTPKEIVQLLLSVWSTLTRWLPRSEQFSPARSGFGWRRTMPDDFGIDDSMRDVRRLLRENVQTLGHFYPVFFNTELIPRRSGGQ